MIQNPYEVLGLPRDAAPELVKAAYRKLAQKWHPDREGGDELRFKDVKLAYEILSDEQRRKRFDETGHDEQLDAKVGAVRSALVQLMFSFIDATALDISRNDVRAMMLNHVSQTGQTLRQNITVERAKIKRYSKVMKRFKRRRQDGPNLFGDALQDRIRDCEKTITGIEETISINREVIRALDDYTYDTLMADEPDAPLLGHSAPRLTR